MKNNFRNILLRFGTAFLAFSLLLGASSCTEHLQSNKAERNAIKSGNKSYKNREFSDAAESYREALEANPNSEVAKLNLAMATLISNEADSTRRAQADSLLQNLAQSATDPEVSEHALYTLSNFSVYIGDELKSQAESDADQGMAQELSKKSTEYYKQAISGYQELLRRKPGDLKVTQNLRITQLKLPPEQDNQDQDNQDQQEQQQDQQQEQQQQQQQQPQPQADALNALEKREMQTRKRQVQPATPVRSASDKPW